MIFVLYYNTKQNMDNPKLENYYTLAIFTFSILDIVIRNYPSNSDDDTDYGETNSDILDLYDPLFLLWI